MKQSVLMIVFMMQCVYCQSGSVFNDHSNLSAYVAAWWLFSVLANFLSKKGLNAFPSATFLTLSQMACGSLTLLFFQRKDIFKELSKYGNNGRQKVVFISFVQFMGNLFTNWSMILVPVSFTHTVKGAEPLFTYFFGFLLVKQEIRLWTIISILMVVTGVGLSSKYELQFSWLGFLLALGSNACFAIRNVLVGTLPKECKKSSLFGFSSLFGTVFAMINLLLSLVFQPGSKMSPNPGSEPNVAIVFLAAGLAHFSYNLYSFRVLGKVKPLTHSLINVFKRILVIFGSMLFFKQSLYFGNVVGILVTLSGIGLYSYMSKNANNYSRISESAYSKDENETHTLKGPKTSSFVGASRKLSLVTILCGFFGFFVLSGRLQPKNVGLIKPITSYRDVRPNLFRDADMLMSITKVALNESFSQSYVESMADDHKFNGVLFSRQYIRNCLNFQIPDPDSLQGTNIVIDSEFGYDRTYMNLLDQSANSLTANKYDIKNGKAWICGENDSGENTRCKSSQYTICPPQMLTCVFQSIICKSIPVVDKGTIESIKSSFPNSPFLIYSYQEYISGSAFSPGMVDRNMDIFLDQHTISWIEEHGRRVVFPSDTINVCECMSRKDILKDFGNVGDLLGQKLIAYMIREHFPIPSKIVAKSIFQDCPRIKGNPVIYSVGSIVSLSDRVDIPVIWGSGKSSSKPMVPNNKAYWLGVRGPRTREFLLVNHDINPTVVGDPALFSRIMYPMKKLFKHEVGFIIHPVDAQVFKDKFPQFKDYMVNPEHKIDRYIRQLSKYKLVVSSSLHGIIFCHTYGIPVLPVRLGDLISGGDYKFKDHYHMLGYTDFRRRVDVQEIIDLNVKDLASKIRRYWQPVYRPIVLDKLLDTFPIIEIQSPSSKS